MNAEEDEAPIHHPWLRKLGQRGQGLFMDSGLVEASPPAGSEGVRDESGTREGHERSSDQGQSRGEEGSRST